MPNLETAFNETTIKLFPFLEMDGIVVTTWKVGSTWFTRRLVREPHDVWNWYDLNSTDSTIRTTFSDNIDIKHASLKLRSILMYYKSLVDITVPMYIMYRNPYKRFVSAFMQDYLNFTRNNEILKQVTGHDNIKDLLPDVCEKNNISTKSEIYTKYHRELNFGNDSVLRNTETEVSILFNDEYIEITRAIILYILDKRIKYKSFFSDHNTQYLSTILRLVTSNNIPNLKLVDLDFHNLANVFSKYIPKNIDTKIELEYDDAPKNTKINTWPEGTYKMINDIIYAELKRSGNVQDSGSINGLFWSLNNEYNIYNILKSNSNNLVPTNKLII